MTKCTEPEFSRKLKEGLTKEHFGMAADMEKEWRFAVLYYNLLCYNAHNTLFFRSLEMWQVCDTFVRWVTGTMAWATAFTEAITTTNISKVNEPLCICICECNIYCQDTENLYVKMVESTSAIGKRVNRTARYVDVAMYMQRSHQCIYY
jgi:hypothetical protein